MPRHIYATPFVIKPPDNLIDKQPGLRRLSHRLGLKYASKSIVTEEDLQTMGSALWQTLALDNAFDTAYEKAGATVLSVIIESGISDVQALPWETLYHPEHGFLGKHAGFTLSRRREAPQPQPSPVEKGPLRVLLFTSLPDDLDPETSRLNVEEEQVQVQEALMPWIAEGIVQLEMPDDGRFSTLKDMLKDFQPHLLFLSGHGRFHHEPHTGEPPYGEFLFESETGASNPVKEEEIAQALVGTGVQAVVLSACESGKAASDALNNGLTQSLSALGIPHVIGMRESIFDTAGIQFARALCDELARQERVDSALQTARAAIQTPFKDIPKREAGFEELAELSMGQWCLPMLLSPNPEQPLIDWEFQPKQPETNIVSESVQTIALPARFIGRRAEMRQYKSRILNGELKKLLITGPGGQGKTSLAGKLALDLQARGYRVFAWSARMESPWRAFEFELETALRGDFASSYDRMRPRFEDDKQQAEFLLKLLSQQMSGRLVLFFDNLETLQNPDTFHLEDSHIVAWLDAARKIDHITLLLTSRWQLPDWSGDHLPLAHASFGDFLRMAQQLALNKQMPMSLLGQREQLRRIYEVLGGNGRGLEFFVAAVRGMENPEEESAFLESLAQTKVELQADMAIERVIAHLPENARTLLQRLPAYLQPVPVEGINKLGLDLDEDPKALLSRLLMVSLVEVQEEPRWEVIQYQCTPLVAEWLRENNLLDSSQKWKDMVADYQVYLHRYERRTLTQAMAAHAALLRAGRRNGADRLALNYIVGPLNRAGFYRTILEDWLPGICESDDLQTQGEALGQTGKQYLHIGDYETALSYLQKSLAIQQQIGDKAGEGTTLNNISQIYDAQGDYETALSYLQKSLAIRQQIGDKAGEGTTLNNISHYMPRATTRRRSPTCKNRSPSGSKSATKPGKAPRSTICRATTRRRSPT